MEALSGPLQELPDMPSGYDELKVKKHDQLGQNHKILKGAFVGSTVYNYPLENPKAFYQILGGLIEEVAKFEISSEVSAFQDEEVAGAPSGAIAQASAVAASSVLTLKEFTQGETITGTNTANGILERIEGGVAYIKKTNATAFTTDIVTGGTSGAKFKISAVANNETTANAPEELTITQFTDADGLTGGTSGATAAIDDIVYKHHMFAWRDGPSYSHEFVYEDLTVGIAAPADERPQKDHTGVVCDSVAFDVVSNDVPKIKQSWQMAKTVDADTKATKQTNVVTTLFEWTNIPSSGLVVNSINYEALFKTFNLEIKRKLGKIHGNSRNPKSIKGPELEFTLKIGIHRQDVKERDLVTNWGSSAGAPVAGSFVFNRGTSGIDSFTITFASLRVPKINEAVGDETILQELEFGIEGTGIVTSYDKIQYYGSAS